MRIAVGADHGGYWLKQQVISFLEENGIEFEDFGTYSCEKSVDYPDYGKKVARAVAAGDFDRGIVFCGTGIGISIAANKVRGVRCALCHDTFSAKASREHNNANILALGGRVIGKGPALEIVSVWLEHKFVGGRHKRRVEKIWEIEKEAGR